MNVQEVILLQTDYRFSGNSTTHQTLLLKRRFGG